MTALEPYNPPANGSPERQLVRVQPRTVVALTEWAQSAQAAHEVATSLVQTSFVPEAFRNKPHEATAAILAGDEVGLSPMAALRSFDIIQGTAAPRAMTLRAIVQSKGHEVWVKESTDTRAIVCGRRVGSSIVQESAWDTARARGLGLLGKHNWKAQPKAMLVARATAEVCRMIASDAILGVPYAVEEIADGDLAEPTTPAADAGQPTRRRTAQRRTAQRTAPAPSPAPAAAEPASDEPAGPPLPGEDGYDDLDQAGPAPADDRMVTNPQLTKLGAYFSEHGVSDRAQRLRIVSALVGRELGSSKELTMSAASDLIETLEGLAESHGDHTADALVGIAEETEQAAGGES